jgi:hypothetical protein
MKSGRLWLTGRGSGILGWAAASASWSFFSSFGVSFGRSTEMVELGSLAASAALPQLLIAAARVVPP